MSDKQRTLDNLDQENNDEEINSDQPLATLERSEFGELPEDWEYVRSDEIFKYIKSGISDSQNQDGIGVPVSRIETISDGSINYNKVGYVDTEKDLEKHRLNEGDLLFSNINSRDEIGKTAIYWGEETLYHGMNLLRIRYNDEVVHPVYAYYVYDSPMAQNVFFRMSKAAVGQSSINQSQMKSFFLPVPPMETQKKIATILLNIETTIEKVDEYLNQLGELQSGLNRDLIMGEESISEGMEIAEELDFNGAEHSK